MGKSKRLWNNDWAISSIVYSLYKLQLLDEDGRTEFFQGLDRIISLCTAAMKGKKDVKEKARQEILARNLEWMYCPLGESWLKEPTGGTDGMNIKVDPT